MVGDLHDGSDMNYTGSIMINRFRPRTTEIESQAAGRVSRVFVFHSVLRFLNDLYLTLTHSQTFQTLNDRMLQIKVNTETTDFSDLKVRERIVQ